MQLKTLRPQILVITAALALIIGMFFLPRVIINKDKQGALSKAGAARDKGTAPATGEESHEGHAHAPGEGHDAEEMAHVEATPQQLGELQLLRRQYDSEQISGNRLKLATQLGEKYAAISKYDSAGYFYEQAANVRPGETAYQKAADQYFEAFSFAATEDRSKVLGERARSLYEKVLKNNPANLDAKTNIAMTYIASESPMQGITLLREVITTDPNNEKALFNLGILSIQSTQYDKAVERFEKLVSINPKHVQGNFYLGVALAESGKKQEAEVALKKAKSLSDDPGFQTSVDNELSKLK